MRVRISAGLRALADNRAEKAGLTRFFRNPRVTADEILRSVAERTGSAAAGRHVLLIEDTSEINYEAKAGRKRGLGRVGNGSDVGLFVHPALRSTPATAASSGLQGLRSGGEPGSRRTITRACRSRRRRAGNGSPRR